MDEVYVVKPIYKALQLLRQVGEADRDLSLAEVCRLTRLPKSTAFKYLRTLLECGFLSHDPDTDRYRLGLAVWHLARLSDGQQTVRQVVLPFMRTLRDRFDETVNLGILDCADVVYLEILPSRRSLRMQATLGCRDPAYSTALGKAMLSFLAPEQQSSHLPARLASRTTRTVTSIRELRAEMRTIRRCGYALDRGENEEGLSCIAAPVLAAEGRVAGALSVSAPASRTTCEMQREVIGALTTSARRASERLGHIP